MVFGDQEQLSQGREGPRRSLSPGGVLALIVGKTNKRTNEQKTLTPFPLVLQSCANGGVNLTRSHRATGGPVCAVRGGQPVGACSNIEKGLGVFRGN